MRLLEAIAARAGVANKLAADRRRIDANLPRDVGLRVAALQERVNLAALFAGQMEIAFGHFSSVRCAVPRKDSLPSDRQKNRHIPRSRHDPKILWVDDAEIVGDRITKVRPIPRNLFTQKTERRIGELGASCVALVVSDVSVHEAP